MESADFYSDSQFYTYNQTIYIELQLFMAVSDIWVQKLNAL